MQRYQSGSALIVLVLGLSVGMLVWFGVSGVNSALEARQAYEQTRLLQLEQIKASLLNTALFVPEQYEANSSGQLLPPQLVRGVGYLPCPADASGRWDGSPCGNPRKGYVSSSNTGDSHTGITALGYVPLAIKNRNIYLSRMLRKGGFRYIVDERFVSNNGCYDITGTGKFPYPVNATLSLPNPPAPSACGTANALPLDKGHLPVPFLTIDNRSGYVALLIDPGPDRVLAAENADGDDRFTRKNNDDIIVGIHYKEWSETVLQRWNNEKSYWMSFAQQKGWPWAYHPSDNPVGQAWAM
ncbi:hypothetical protein D6779_01275 [Candidatus Parcubacteria bacterium]|nr:MAG: hypothetical protein D6779_01275 [Candidatus Parcubacteria bacterium]